MLGTVQYDHLVIPDGGARLGRNNQDDRSLSYSFRDIPTFDGIGDSLPRIHMLNLVTSLITLDQNLEICLKSHRQMIENITWQ